MLSVCIGILGAMPITEAFALVAQSGIEGVELLGDPALYDADTLLAELAGHGLTVTALTAAARLPTGRDLSHPDPAIRAATIDHLRRCVEFARRIGAPVVAVAPAAIGRYWLEEDRASEWNWAAEGLRTLAIDADRCGVQLGIEILNRYAAPIVTTVATAQELIESAGGGPIGLVMDTFHSAIEERSVTDAIRDAGRSLVNLQVADNNREPPGHGRLDFAAMARALSDIRYEGAISLEAFPPGSNAFPDVTPDKIAATAAYVREFPSFISTLPFASEIGHPQHPLDAFEGSH
jgi:sugar phosphate isomerase/epimerase